MPKNVMKLLKPSPHRSRNAFDLSHRHVHTANFGELLPSTCIETVPGDHITLHASNLLRALPMVTSPFLRAKQHLDVWFVPYSQLWTNFNEFMTGKSEPRQSVLKNSAYCPHVQTTWLGAALNDSDGMTDVVGRNYLAGARKLANLLGYPTSGGFSLNLWRILAYNKIWYDEYRQPYYDDGTRLWDVGNGSPAYLFNVDDFDCSDETGSDIAHAGVLSADGEERIRAMFQMRYRCWKKDLFTGLLPSTQFGSVSTVSGDVLYSSSELEKYNFLGLGENNRLQTQSAVPGTLSGGRFAPRAYYVDSTFSFDALSLRRSEAVQLWRENALRAGNRISDNIDAHYGVRPAFEDDSRPVYLGSVSAPLNIGDVNATADTGLGINGSLGDVAGKGLSSLDEKVFTFDSKDFGVIMVMFSLLPEAEYEARGISRMNQLLEREDYFIPEYENLGLEGVSKANFFATSVQSNNVIGYAPRYYGYKTKLDKCYEGFYSLGTGAGDFQAWCSPKTDVVQVLNSNVTALPLSLLYVNPALYDVNFGVSVDNSEQFLCDMYYDVNAVRPMSVVGLPFS